MFPRRVDHGRIVGSSEYVKGSSGAKNQLKFVYDPTRHQSRALSRNLINGSKTTRVKHTIIA